MQEMGPPVTRRASAPTIGCMVVVSMTLAASTFAGSAQPPTSESQRAARVIEKALQKHGTDVHRCFERSLADRLDTSGKLEIEVEVGPAGR